MRRVDLNRRKAQEALVADGCTARGLAARAGRADLERELLDALALADVEDVAPEIGTELSADPPRAPVMVLPTAQQRSAGGEPASMDFASLAATLDRMDGNIEVILDMLQSIVRPPSREKSGAKSGGSSPEEAISSWTKVVPASRRIAQIGVLPGVRDFVEMLAGMDQGFGREDMLMAVELARPEVQIGGTKVRPLTSTRTRRSR